MTSLPATSPDSPGRAAAGITSIIVSMALFVVLDGMMKSLIATYSIWQLIFARGVLAVLILSPIILLLGRPHRLFTPLWPLHLARAFLLAGGFSLFYAAFPFMGLAEVSTIFFSAPLMTAIMAAVFLGETIGRHRIVALLVGFSGVLIAMAPGGETFQWVAILPLICAVFYALAQILSRVIGERETALTSGLYTVTFAGLLIWPIAGAANLAFDFGPEFRHLHFQFVIPEGRVFWLIVLLGTIGMLGYLALSHAYQVTRASLVAPFDYSYLPMATIMAYVVWGEVPPTATLIGMGLIIASGLYLGYRELRSASTEPLPVAEAAVAPGNPVAPISAAREYDD